jgi:Zn-dependent protease with chaperone function
LSSRSCLPFAGADGALRGVAIKSAEPVTPGTIDRTSFFAEQRRRRRQTWRLVAVCLLVVGFIGFIASTVISPLVLAVGGLGLRLAQHVAPSSLGIAAARRAIIAWVDRGIADLGTFSDRLDQVRTLSDALALVPYATAFAALLVPGIVAMLVAYFALYVWLRRSAGTAIPLALNARDPMPGDFVEHRLTNIVEEMAIAGGLGVPKVMLVDDPAANAAAFRASGSEAIVLVTRGLLDKLERSETEAVIGHLVGSIGNSDWRLMCSLMAVFETLGLFLSIIDLPFRANARRAVWRLVNVAVSRANRPADSAAIAELLSESIGSESVTETSRFLGMEDGGSRLRKVLTFPLLPLGLLNIFLKLVLWLWVSLLLGFVVALLWRNRRYLADASAVQLTRDPDALAEALQKLGLAGGIPAGGAGVDYVFFAGPQRSRSTGFGNKRGVFLPLQPPLRARLRRVIAMGAKSSGRPVGAMPLAGKAAVGCLMLVLAPLIVVLYAAVSCLTLMALMISGGIAAMLMVWAIG